MKTEKALKILEEIKELDDSIYQYNQAYMEALDLEIIAIKKDIGTPVFYTTDKTHPQMCPNCRNKLERPYHHCIFCGQNLRYPDNRTNIIDQIKPHGPVPCWNYKKGPEPKC